MVHNNINLDSIWIDAASKSVEIFPSELTLHLPERRKAALAAGKPGNRIMRQIAYIAPEQTGRTIHPVDFRSDYYSLGVILYRLLTGVLPFDFEQPLDNIHAHIAVMPPSADNEAHDIPPVLSDIILKLMAKNPAERYQSAAGLIFDLKKCLRLLQTTGRVDNFTLAVKDLSPIFEIPPKLYGRYREIQLLCGLYKQVVKSRGVGMIFFNGPPGIGKSFLINEMQSHLIEKEGRFISGKFDQFEKTIPCSAVIQAFSGLIRRMLTLNEDQLAEQRHAILAAVGKNGRFIIDLIPELELIIGKQPEVEKLSALETQNRFNYVFQKFVRSIISPENPLILFLDDLHWADSASLYLLEAILLDIDLNNLLFIGAYRDIEGLENPFLGEFLKNLRQQKPEAKVVGLGPVDDEYVEMLVSDILSLDLDHTSEFIKLVVTKTNCNPLFIKEFLKNLHEENLIRFIHAEENSSASHWQIDMEGVLKAELPDTIVALLTQRIQKLPAISQDCLKTAACIGMEFSVDVLAMVCKNPLEKIREYLEPALEQGFLILLDGGFKFIHDRVREAAYLLNDSGKRANIHYAVGKALSSGILKSRPDEIFMIASQLNSARKLISPDERKELIRLNLNAGRMAKQLTAYATALEYFNAGLELLEEEAWETHYATTLALHDEAAETAFLCANIDYSETLVELILQNTHTTLDQVKAYEVRIRTLISQKKLSRALEEGTDFLRQIGCKVPVDPGKISILYEFITLKYTLRQKKIHELLDVKNAPPPHISAQYKIINSISACAYRIRPNILYYLVLNSLRQALKQGCLPDTATYFTHYGLFLGELGKIDAGYRYGLLARELIKRPDVTPFIRTQVLLSVNSGMMSWKHHFRDTLMPLRETYNLCMESGNLITASYIVIIYFLNSVNSGLPLADIFAEMNYYYEIMRQCRQQSALDYLRTTAYQLIINYTGLSESSSHMQSNIRNEEEMLRENIISNDMLATFSFYSSKMKIHYFKGNYLEAVKNSELALKYLKLNASVIKPLYHFHDALARLALVQTNRTVNRSGKKMVGLGLRSWIINRYHFKKIAADQKVLKKWAGHAPMNFLNKWTLIEAERARADEKRGHAEKYYHQAIELSKQHQFIHEEALSNELLARFYLSHSNKSGAEKHLKAAIDLLDKWGAKARCRQLSKEYDRLFAPANEKIKVVEPFKTIEPHPRASSAVTLAEMDLQLFTDMLNSISDKSDRGDRIDQLCENIMKYSGAQRVLLLFNKDELFVTANKCVGVEADASTSTQIDMIFPEGIVRYAARTKKSLLIDDAYHSELFAADAYVKRHQVKSVICIPLAYGKRLSAVLYLENSLSHGVFTSIHLKILESLSRQIALILENESLNQPKEIENSCLPRPDLLVEILQGKYGLTPQEIKISTLFKEGCTRAQICETLNISAPTLKKHLQMIYDKTVNFEDNFSGEGRVDKLSRLILFLFKQSEAALQGLKN